MNVADIVRRVRESAGDSGVVQFSNATLTDWINDGIRECVQENSLLQARVSTPTVEEQSEYVLPENIFKIHSVYYDTRKLLAVSLEQWEERYSGNRDVDGSPSQFYIYGGVLNLFPTPDSVKSLTVNYSKLPTSIGYNSSSDSWAPEELEIPEVFHSRIVTYCLAQVAFQDDNDNKYQLLMNEFRTGIRDLKSSKNQEEDLYPFISVSSRDAGDDWGDW